MHCPRCGQQQVSEEIKFCSRCGFPLGLVSELLSHGGFLPQLAQTDGKKKLWTRKNGLKFGLAWFLVLTFLVTPILAIADGDEIVAVSAVLGFMGGIFIMLFSWLFLPAENKSNDLPANQMNQTFNHSPQQFRTAPSRSALPPQQTQPAESYIPPMNSWKAPDTGDLAQPGSVTEGTTKLLTRDE